LQVAYSALPDSPSRIYARSPKSPAEHDLGAELSRRPFDLKETKVSAVLTTKPRPPADDIADDAQQLAQVLQRVLATPPQPREAARPRLAVLWVYRDYDGRWCVREEGGSFAAAFSNRERAAACARAAGRAAGSYRLFLQLNAGRVTEELFNPARREPQEATRVRLPFIH